jgi:DNA-binding NtrC family response regulator
VRGHRGAIDIASAPGRGTRFRIFLPAAGAGRAATGSRRDEPDACPARGAVLIVDDDEGVRALAEETLRRAGIETLCAGDGATAVALFERNPDAVDVVLLDRTMPAAGGAACLEALRRLRPSLPIVLMSGYAQEAAAAGLAEGHLAGFVQKPFLPDELVARIREALSS